MTVADSAAMSIARRLQLLAAGEGEQPADQLGALLGGARVMPRILLLLLLQLAPRARSGRARRAPRRADC